MEAVPNHLFKISKTNLRMKQFQVKTPSLHFATLLSIFLIQLTACKKEATLIDPVENKDTISIPVPTDSIPAPVDTLASPNDSLPGPIDPIELYGKMRMQWAPTDYREIFYDADKYPIRTVQENLYVQNSNITRKVQVDFTYNSARQLIQTRSSNGTYVNYTYEGNQVKTTEEFASDGFLLKIRTYHFEGNKLLKVTESNHYSRKDSEIRYYYGTWGNLTEVRTYAKNPETKAFDSYNAVRYLNYDYQKNSENLWTVYPYLPNVQFAQNNFQEVAFFYFDGKVEKEVSTRKKYTYQYTSEGYPARRIETGASGLTLTADYSYTGL